MKKANRILSLLLALSVLLTTIMVVNIPVSAAAAQQSTEWKVVASTGGASKDTTDTTKFHLLRPTDATDGKYKLVVDGRWLAAGPNIAAGELVLSDGTNKVTLVKRAHSPNAASDKFYIGAEEKGTAMQPAVWTKAESWGTDYWSCLRITVELDLTAGSSKVANVKIEDVVNRYTDGVSPVADLTGTVDCSALTSIADLYWDYDERTSTFAPDHSHPIYSTNKAYKAVPSSAWEVLVADGPGEKTGSSGNYVTYSFANQTEGQVKFSYDFKGIDPANDTNTAIGIFNAGGTQMPDNNGIITHIRGNAVGQGFAASVGNMVRNGITNGSWYHMDVVVDIDAGKIDYTITNANGDIIGGGIRSVGGITSFAAVKILAYGNGLKYKNFTVYKEAEPVEGYTWVNKYSAYAEEARLYSTGERVTHALSEAVNSGKVRFSYEYKNSGSGNANTYARWTDGTSEDSANGNIVMDKTLVVGNVDEGKDRVSMTTSPTAEFYKVEAIFDLDADKILYTVTDASGAIIGRLTYAYTKAFKGLNIYAWPHDDGVNVIMKNVKIDVYAEATEEPGQPGGGGGTEEPDEPGTEEPDEPEVDTTVYDIVTYQGAEATSLGMGAKYTTWDIPDRTNGKVRLTYDVKLPTPTYSASNPNGVQANEEIQVEGTNGTATPLVSHTNGNIGQGFGEGGLVSAAAETWYTIMVTFDLDADTITYSVKDAQGAELLASPVTRKYTGDVAKFYLNAWNNTAVTRKNFKIETSVDNVPEGYTWVNKYNTYAEETRLYNSGEKVALYLPEAATSGRVRFSYEYKNSGSGNANTYARWFDGSAEDSRDGNIIMSNVLQVGNATTGGSVATIATSPTAEFYKVEAVIDLDGDIIYYTVKDAAGNLIGASTYPYTRDAFKGLNAYAWPHNDNVSVIMKNVNIDVYAEATEEPGGGGGTEEPDEPGTEEPDEPEVDTTVYDIVTYQGAESASHAGGAAATVWDIPDKTTGKVRVTYDVKLPTPTYGPSNPEGIQANEELCVVNAAGTAVGIINHSNGNFGKGFEHGGLIGGITAETWYTITLTFDLDADTFTYSVKDANGTELLASPVTRAYASDISKFQLNAWNNTKVTRRNFKIEVSAPEVAEGYEWVNKVDSYQTAGNITGTPTQFIMSEAVTSGRAKLSYEFKRNENKNANTYIKFTDGSTNEDADGNMIMGGATFRVGRLKADDVTEMIKTVPTDEYVKVEAVVDLDEGCVYYSVYDATGTLVGARVADYTLEAFMGMNAYAWPDGNPTTISIKNFKIDVLENATAEEKVWVKVAEASALRADESNGALKHIFTQSLGALTDGKYKVVWTGKLLAGAGIAPTSQLKISDGTNSVKVISRNSTTGNVASDPVVIGEGPGQINPKKHAVYNAAWGGNDIFSYIKMTAIVDLSEGSTKLASVTLEDMIADYDETQTAAASGSGVVDMSSLSSIADIVWLNSETSVHATPYASTVAIYREYPADETPDNVVVDPGVGGTVTPPVDPDEPGTEEPEVDTTVYDIITYQGVESVSHAGGAGIVKWDIPDKTTGKVRVTYDVKLPTKTYSDSNPEGVQANEELLVVNAAGTAVGIINHSNGNIGKGFEHGGLVSAAAETWYTITLTFDLDKDTLTYSVKDAQGEELLTSPVTRAYASDISKFQLNGWNNTKVTRRNFKIETSVQTSGDPSDFEWVNKVTDYTTAGNITGIPTELVMEDAVTSGRVKLAFEFRRAQDISANTYIRLTDGTTEGDRNGNIVLGGKSLVVGKTDAYTALISTVPVDEYVKLEAIVDLDADLIFYTLYDAEGNLLGAATYDYTLNGFKGINAYAWPDNDPTPINVKNFTIDVWGKDTSVYYTVGTPEVAEEYGISVLVPNVKIVNNTEEGIPYTVVVAFFDSEGILVDCQIEEGTAGTGTTEAGYVELPEEGAVTARAFLWKSIDTIVPIQVASEMINL